MNDVWKCMEEQRERGKRAAALAAEHKLHLTTTERRSWYEDSWTETVVDWGAVADLLDKVAPGWARRKEKADVRPLHAGSSLVKI